MSNFIVDYAQTALEDHAQVTRLPSGAWVVPANITRIGIYNYVLDGKPARVLRKPEDVFDPKSVATLDSVPVTVLHPGENEVTPQNYRTHVVGHVRNPKVEGRYIRADLVIGDEETARALARDANDPQRLVEVSAGYYTDISDESGVDPTFGPYERRHRNVVYNHVSLGPRNFGRAGRDVAVILDSRTATDGDEDELAAAARRLNERYGKQDPNRPIEPKTERARAFVEGWDPDDHYAALVRRVGGR